MWVAATGGSKRGGRWLLAACLLNTAAILYLFTRQQDDPAWKDADYDEDVIVEESPLSTISSVLDTMTSTVAPLENTAGDLNSSRAFLLDTPSCRIPNLTPVNPSILKYFEDQPTSPNCSEQWWSLPGDKKTRGPPLVQSNLTAMWVVREAMHHYNVSDLSLLSCCYRPFWRVQEDPNNYTRNADCRIKFLDICIPFNGEVVKISAEEHEFLRVECSRLPETTTSSSTTEATTSGSNDTTSATEGSTVTSSTTVTTTTEAPKPEEIYRDFHVFVPLKRHVEERCINFDKGNDEVNVMILGIDAVSRLNMLRQLPLLHEALTSPPFSGIEVLGFNKVGDNTFPNVMAMLTGLEEEDLTEACPWPTNKHKLDPCPFIWKEFAKRGYRTLFNEDMGFTFTYCKTGFVEQPTDYYGIPFSSESRDQLGHSYVGGFDNCMGSRPILSNFLDLIRKFTERFRYQRFFTFFWINFLCHNDMNMPHNGDQMLRKLVTDLQGSGVLNSTVLIVCSDHGSRIGSFRSTYQGQMEERLPFMIIIFPEWFKRRFPAAVANVRRNSRNRLVTQYDVHETLRDLLEPAARLEPEELRSRAGVEVPPDPALRASTTSNYRQETTLKDDVTSQSTNQETAPKHPPKRGISMFLPIPNYRTCQMASIPPHYCCCQARETLALNASVVQSVATFVVTQVNAMLFEYRQCALLRLAEVRRAQRNVPIGLGSHSEETRVIDYLVALETHPGGALFEATVRQAPFDPKQNETPAFELAGPVSRINMYGNQSHCVDNFHMKLYCFCT